MKQNKKRLILTGAQGVGKSTILNHYKDLGYNCITEVVRNLAKTGVNINEMGDDVGQKTIFKEYQKLLKSKKGYISDRGLSDVASYTVFLALTERVKKVLADKQFLAVQKFHQDNPDIIVCYIPIEFPVEDDGVRSTDENFRSSIDFMIKNLLDCANIPYHTITGTVEERVAMIDKLLQE